MMTVLVGMRLVLCLSEQIEKIIPASGVKGIRNAKGQYSGNW